MRIVSKLVIWLFFSQVFFSIAQADLMKGIEAFEDKNYEEAARILYPLRRTGAIVPFKYLEYMKTHTLAVINDDYADDFEPIPTDGHTLSNSFLQASLASIVLKNNTKKGIGKLEPLILSGNARAITLIEKEFEADQSKVKFFKNNKLKKIQTKDGFKEHVKYTSLGPIDLANGIELPQLFSLNPADFKPDFYKAIKTLKVNAQKYPDRVGNLAFQVADMDETRPFWHFLAFENGECASNLRLASHCLKAVTSRFKNSDDAQLRFTQAEEEALGFFRYYASKLDKNSYGKSDELSEVLLRYGALLGDGIGGKKDPIKERQCYEIAAEKGNAAAQHNYAYMLEMGEGGDEDLIEARRYYKIATDQGYEDAQVNYALMLLTGTGGSKELVEARRHFKMAADQGNMIAQYRLAVMAVEGEGGEVDLEEAIHNFKKSADQGYAGGQYGYALALVEKGNEEDLPEARRYYKMSADQGAVEAQNNYARMAFTGAGGEIDLAESFLYSERAAKQGFAIAEHNYGVLLWHGLGCHENQTKALDYLQKSANQGHTKALVLMQKLKRELVQDNEDHPIDLNNPNTLQIVKKVFDENLKKENIFRSANAWNLRDITLDIEHHHSTNYVFNNQLFKPTFFESSHKFIRPGMLQHIKEKIHASPKTDKLPNIAVGFLTLHYDENGISKHMLINLEERYLSGGKFFGTRDLEFKKLKRIVNAMQDMLDESEKKEIYKLPVTKKGLALGKAMETKLRQQIIGGPWKNNCVDSEAILLLRLVQRLPAILDQIHEVSDINITGLVLGISSYRDACLKCQQLIQGFQWAAKDLLQSSLSERMRIDDAFGTLAISYGQVRPQTLCHEEEPVFLKDDAVLAPGNHKLIRCRAKNRDM